MNPGIKELFGVDPSDEEVKKLLKQLFVLAQNAIATRLRELPPDELPLGAAVATGAALTLAAFYVSAAFQAQSPEQLADLMREAPWLGAAALALSVREHIATLNSKGDA